jgi:hypothetical protein
MVTDEAWTPPIDVEKTSIGRRASRVAIKIRVAPNKAQHLMRHST